MSLQKNNNKAFTLAEMMVVLLVLSIVTAAFLPVITQRLKKSSGGGATVDLWNLVTGTDASPSIHYGADDNKKAVVIGAKTLDTTNISTRLFINTPKNDTMPHVVFAKNGAVVGQLRLDQANNTGLGLSALGSNTSGNNNTAFGNQSLMANTSGIGNVAVGYKALIANTSGSANVAAGFSALAANVSGNNNTAVGFSMLSALNSGSDNIAVGDFALGQLSSGSRNIAIGVEALPLNTTGNENIGVGRNVGAGGERDIALGIKSCFNSSKNQQSSCFGAAADIAEGISFATAVGAGAKVTGNYATAIGYVGTTAAENSIVLGAVDQKVIIPGILKIGTLVGKLKAENGEFKIDSDRRLKNIKGEFSGGLEQIRKLQTYNFTFKKDEKNTPQVGIMAQDLQKIFPNAVTKGDDGYLMIRKEEMFYAMINSIKQLDKIVQNLVSQVQTSLAKIQNIEDNIIALAKVDKIHFGKIKELESSNKSIEVSLSKLERASK